MNTADELQDDARKEHGAKGKEYRSPVLHVYGTVRGLTKSGAGTLGDAGTGKRPRV
jgi:hypothetical protein